MAASPKATPRRSGRSQSRPRAAALEPATNASLLPRPTAVTLLALAAAAAVLVPAASIRDHATQRAVAVSALVSAAGFFATRALIPLVAARTLRAGLFGMDINKKGTKAGERRIPEAAGLAPGAVFLACLAVFQHLHASGGVGPPGPALRITDAWHVDYNAALAACAFMLLLGFADDVLDVPWRVKLVLPALASLPLVVAYGGGTGVVLPKPLTAMTGWPAYVELGWLYKAYMVALVTFCANAINILAGVNGLEAGQTLVICGAVGGFNAAALGAAAARGAVGAADGHLFSLFIVLPLGATTAGLLWHNWYPSDVFVGDTYTYFAGTALAVAGILGHFSETLLVFLVPQVFNFVYSVPQLFKLVPCPRHRLPRFDPATGLLHPTPNWNLVNLALTVGGPTTERGLCVRLLALQALCCAGGFGLRAALAGVYKG